MGPRIVLLAALALPAAGAAAADAPGAPGAKTVWAPADKQGFGTATGVRSKVWFTLQGGALSEVYYPTLGTPNVRDLELVVSDGRTFTDRERSATRNRVELLRGRGLTYRQVNTATSGRYRIVKTYVTDPRRDTVLVSVRFRSLTGRPYRVYVLHDPALSNDGDDDTGAAAGRTLVASDGTSAAALRAAPGFRRRSSGYLGASDGWTDLRADHRMDWSYARAAQPGNVVQTARTALDGVRHTRLRLALGFGGTGAAARAAAAGSLRQGYAPTARHYAAGWRAYLRRLRRPPRSVRGLRRTYAASVMLLAAHEDKTFRGASIASPTMPWVWGANTIEHPSGPYHLVWARDLYQVATAQLAAGDRAAARRLLGFLFERQQKTDGSFPQNSEVTGAEHWTSLQLDEVSFPIVLAWQLRRFDAGAWRRHVKPAADFILANGPQTPQERWENQSGYSPATIAAEIAALVCASDIARRNGDTAAATRYAATADDWRSRVDSWTVTTNGPLADHPYYLRLTKDGNPNAGTTYDIGDSGPSSVDQRRVVDPSFLELVRLGVKRATDPNVVRTLPVVDRELKVSTPHGPFWHRFSFDGYGETRSGEPWEIGTPDTFRTLGRAWPIFAGERGEYALADGRPAARYLRAMAGAANQGSLIPEQVWDGRPPTGRPGFRLGEGTFSATPLAWSHAQFVRLAWSIDAGRPVETPSVVACRYVRRCR
jgi:glucoamylase